MSITIINKIQKFEEVPKIVYIAGPITGDRDYRAKFSLAAVNLKNIKHIPMNPAVLPAGLAYEAYLPICFTMLDQTDAICLLNNWEQSPGVRRELVHALAAQKNFTVFTEKMMMNYINREKPYASLNFDCQRQELDLWIRKMLDEEKSHYRAFTAKNDYETSYKIVKK